METRSELRRRRHRPRVRLLWNVSSNHTAVAAEYVQSASCREGGGTLARCHHPFPPNHLSRSLALSPTNIRPLQAQRLQDRRALPNRNELKIPLSVAQLTCPRMRPDLLSISRADLHHFSLDFVDVIVSVTAFPPAILLVTLLLLLLLLLGVSPVRSTSTVINPVASPRPGIENRRASVSAASKIACAASAPEAGSPLPSPSSPSLPPFPSSSLTPIDGGSPTVSAEAGSSHPRQEMVFEGPSSASSGEAPPSPAFKAG